jgi:hypothetical protein
MEGIDDNIYWSKRPPWKRSQYNRTKKAHNPKAEKCSVDCVKSWQKDYEKPRELVQYYFST